MTVHLITSKYNPRDWNASSLAKVISEYWWKGHLNVLTLVTCTVTVKIYTEVWEGKIPHPKHASCHILTWLFRGTADRRMALKSHPPTEQKCIHTSTWESKQSIDSSFPPRSPHLPRTGSSQGKRLGAWELVQAERPQLAVCITRKVSTRVALLNLPWLGRLPHPFRSPKPCSSVYLEVLYKLQPPSLLLDVTH